MDAQSIAKASYKRAESNMWQWYYLPGLFLVIASFELWESLEYCYDNLNNAGSST